MNGSTNVLAIAGDMSLFGLRAGATCQRITAPTTSRMQQQADPRPTAGEC